MSEIPTMPTGLVCSGCGAHVDLAEKFPFVCTNAGSDDINHVIVRRFNEPEFFNQTKVVKTDPEKSKNPFVRYRRRFHSYYRALAQGMSDKEFVAMVERINKAIIHVDGKGFVVTPLALEDALSQDMGGDSFKIWVKNETVNVSGSHKARHLMGILLHLEWLDETLPTLAIASCGNAALAAAVVARAAELPLDVFIPPDASPVVVEELTRLKARLGTCPREPGKAGDPCYLRFREAVSQGGLPFTCQGSDNGLTIEGGETLGYELLDQLADQGEILDRLFLQVGGGALATSCMDAFLEAFDGGVLSRLPRFQTVQTLSGFPLVRAYDRVVQAIVARLDGKDIPELVAGEDNTLKSAFSNKPEDLKNREALADRIKAAWGTPPVEEVLEWAARNRSLFMWPWETTPHSVAHGILDDETYDWYANVIGMLRSGGYPIVVNEEDLKEANKLARTHTTVAVDHTGTSGFAGLVVLKRAGMIGSGESDLVLFTGLDR